MYLSNAIIEVTRRCNMTCEHCLRGNAQKKDISDEILDNFFSRVSGIGDLTITGGEPSIAVDRIEAILKYAEKYGVPIDNFYIATNAKEVSNAFLIALIKLHCYCGDNENSMVQYSNDDYHDEAQEENIKRLEVFKFVSAKYPDGANTGEYEINEGRAKENGIGVRDRNSPNFTYGTIEDYVDTEYNTISSELELYLNCKGNLVAGCDRSYKNQDRKSNIICNVDDFSMETTKKFVEKKLK